ncbi:hypothetical protein BCR35DRAFT_313392 [Leucosporidium creatinivorum]|uniref:TM7S3/TM198-like domain-containing protein n=1 Tax=Leucosporidium creatinivorum TaxID=106004 RepID=A0A1Y2FQ42_9BASI|nr:hypothetical protein BCR35DRAFT_313392 [Leucosporidium creatinivorum]
MALRSCWTTLPALLVLGPLPAVIAIPTQGMHLFARAADTSSDGSGSAPYRTSPSFLLFALTSLLVGALLLVAGKKLWRVTTALGAGLLLELLVWITIFNTTSDDGLTSSTRTNDLILWAIVTAGAIVGLVIGGFFWRAGMGAMCICGGMSFGFSIAMMAENDLPVVARWIIIGVLSLAGLLAFPFTQNHVGMAIATSLTGSFLLFLGIDLLANQVSGMSLGLRYMLDGNHYHSDELSSYDPPVVTRVLLAVSWCVAIIASAFQTLLYRQPFIPARSHHNRLASSKSDRDLTHTPSPLATPPGLTPEADPAESFRARMNRRYKERLAQGEKELAEAHVSEGSEVSAEALSAHLKELSGMSVSF